MKRCKRRLLLVVFVAVFMLAGGAFDRARCGERVRAKVGIQIRSGDRVLRAKTRDRLHAGDLLRIYVHPEHSSYVYVVHSDGTRAALLNTVEQGMQSSTLVMPSLQEYYQVDGKSSTECFTILCSPKALPEVNTLFQDGQVPHEEWTALAEALSKRGRICLTQEQGENRPFAIAGNVRGAGGASIGDPFSRELQVFSGESLLMKQYTFRVVP